MSSLCCFSNKSLLKQQIILFSHPHPPPCSHHDKQLMVITPFLPVSQGDYILPAQNQMINDHAEQPEQIGGGSPLHLSKVTFLCLGVWFKIHIRFDEKLGHWCHEEAISYQLRCGMELSDRPLHALVQPDSCDDIFSACFTLTAPCVLHLSSLMVDRGLREKHDGTEEMRSFVARSYRIY